MNSKLAILAIFFTTSAFAAGEHAGSHDEFAVGTPGNASDAARTVEVELTETEDGQMVFKPDSVDVKRGETIRFMLHNTGELEHEFVLGKHEKLMDHKKEMMSQMDMKHDDPNAAFLAPGAKAELVWTFTNSGDFQFACLIPGHFETGMVGALVVTEDTAETN